MSEVLLLKHGNPRAYRLCDTCQNYAVNLSFRGWCPACEWECKEVGRKARARLAALSPPAQPASDPIGTAVPGSDGTPVGTEPGV
jgi:hypothetical protein